MSGRSLDSSGSHDLEALLRALDQAGVEADASSRRLAEYAYDASNYRVLPLAVAFPRDAGQVRDAVLACRAAGVAIVPRGGGTGMAGNAIGAGLVLDLSRYMTAVGEVDTARGTVAIEPGVVLSELTAHVETATQGRFSFAPDPSSRNRATVGGAIGNDACGNHSVRYGRTSHHVHELDLVTSDGAMLTATQADLRASDPNDSHSVRRAAEITEQLTDLADRHRGTLRVELGRIARQVSGYALHHLLPENGFDVVRALVGSEGTCAVVVGARMKLVPKPASALLVCLGYADVVDAARDVTTILEYDPAAVEGIDDLILATMRWRRGPDAVVGMPRGSAWLYVDLDGDAPAQVRARADDLIARLTEAGRLVEGKVVPDPVERAVLWRVREDGAGLSSRLAPGLVSGRPESWPGWEDSAVAPENLAAYLADFRALLTDFGLDGVMYGHFGAGCMHVRINFDLRSPEGIDTFRRYLTAAAELVVRHGGSLSGEHGDGRARSALLPIMYSPEMMRAFAEFKAIWDPTGLLNPNHIVDPVDPASDLALDGVPRRDWTTEITFGERRQETPEAQVSTFVEAAQSCIGVGRCRTSSVGVMCPSYRATRDEKDSTRGRARVLQEMIRTAPSIPQGWRSDDVRDALDLCLSCKACSTDCPVGVDMSALKSEFYHHYYEGCRRPASHETLGRLPEWLALAGRLDKATGGRALAAANALVTGAPRSLLSAAMRVAGLTDRRSLPPFAPADAWIAEARRAGVSRPRSGHGDVLLLTDTFTRAFRPHLAGAAGAVLAGVDAGRAVEAAPDVCCGLTYISTGRLDEAKRRLTHAAAALDVDGDTRPIVVVEPSCAAALRHDLPRLVHSDQARRVAERVRSFAVEVADMAAEGRLAQPAHPLPEEVVVQGHCHEYATFGPTTQKRAIDAAGSVRAPVIREAVGCCGVAGNFGFEAEHYEVSVKVAEQALIPAIEGSASDAPVLTDGFSCAMQVDHVAPGRRALHLAEMLDPRPSSM
ncbi:MAG: FAD-binding and (Fe-S)-binding domain-containing protein [Dermatophilus congolensis]|nr:FAD-binding and (Fe-S)-binding domain-containing protein [Dermatophilus congolensis]